jgi:DNA-binding transcriptional MerR regulator
MDLGVTERTLRIGEAAALVGVSPRALRYYHELGLLDPTDHRPGANRRYSRADVARLRRIVELRDVMGFDLVRIGEILRAEDRLATLRTEFRRQTSKRRRAEIYREAMQINRRLREQVLAKMAILEEFLAELDDKAARYRRIARELDIDPGEPRMASSRRKSAEFAVDRATH